MLIWPTLLLSPHVLMTKNDFAFLAAEAKFNTKDGKTRAAAFHFTCSSVGAEKSLLGK